MKWLQIISLVALAGKLACGADGASERDKSPRTDTNASETSSRPKSAAPLPQVLRSSEPKDSRIVMLPGASISKHGPDAAPPAPSIVAKGWRPVGVPALPPAPEVTMARPQAQAAALRAFASVVRAPRFPLPAPSSTSNVFRASGPQPMSAEGPSPDDAPEDVGTTPSGFVTAGAPGSTTGLTALPPDLRKPAYPAGFAQESAVFCQRAIGRWTLADARAILGEPQRQRAAIDDDGTENGHIYAFRDPTSRYRELELDFDNGKGLLRSVFVYPWNLSWQDCRKLWGVNVSATQGSKGRVFYSYVNRHLDVLVDHDGRVISLGLY